MKSTFENRPLIRRIPATTSPLLLVFAALLPNAVVAAAVVDCVTTIREIAEGQDDAINSAPSLDEGVLIPQTFTICPGTTMTLGNSNLYKDTLILRKSNVYIGCGSPSSFDNDCVITGMGTVPGTDGPASIQTYMLPYTKDDFTQTAVENITIEDITFTGVNGEKSPPVQIYSQADSLVFRGCTWKDNYLADYIAHVEDVSKAGDTMNVTFEDCNFVDNVLASAVILNGEQTVTVRRCSFERNNLTSFLEKDDNPYAVVIDAYYGALTVTDSCFNDNIIHLATIATEFNDPEEFVGNYGSNNKRFCPDYPLCNKTQGCDDILRVTNDSTSIFPDFWTAEYECEAFDSGTCKAPTPSPTQMPSSSPEPTSDPSSGTCNTSRAQSFLVVVTFWIGLVAF